MLPRKPVGFLNPQHCSRPAVGARPLMGSPAGSVLGVTAHSSHGVWGFAGLLFGASWGEFSSSDPTRLREVVAAGREVPPGGFWPTPSTLQTLSQSHSPWSLGVSVCGVGAAPTGHRTRGGCFGKGCRLCPQSA